MTLQEVNLLKVLKGFNIIVNFHTLPVTIKLLGNELGNVIKEDPIKIFNSNQFTDYRNKWMSKSYKELEHCKDCSVYMMRFHKTYVS